MLQGVVASECKRPHPQGRGLFFASKINPLWSLGDPAESKAIRRQHFRGQKVFRWAVHEPRLRRNTRPDIVWKVSSALSVDLCPSPCGSGLFWAIDPSLRVVSRPKSRYPRRLSERFGRRKRRSF